MTTLFVKTNEPCNVGGCGGFLSCKNCNHDGTYYTYKPVADKGLLVLTAEQAESYNRLVAAGVKFSEVNNRYTFDQATDSEWQAASDALAGEALDISIDRETAAS